MNNAELAKERLARVMKHGVEKVNFASSEVDALILALQAAQEDARAEKRARDLECGSIEGWS